MHRAVRVGQPDSSPPPASMTPSPSTWRPTLPPNLPPPPKQYASLKWYQRLSTHAWTAVGVGILISELCLCGGCLYACFSSLVTDQSTYRDNTVFASVACWRARRYHIHKPQHTYMGDPRQLAELQHLQQQLHRLEHPHEVLVERPKPPRSSSILKQFRQFRCKRHVSWLCAITEIIVNTVVVDCCRSNPTFDDLSIRSFTSLNNPAAEQAAVGHPRELRITASEEAHEACADQGRRC